MPPSADQVEAGRVGEQLFYVANFSWRWWKEPRFLNDNLYSQLVCSLLGYMYVHIYISFVAIVERGQGVET